MSSSSRSTSLRRTAIMLSCAFLTVVFTLSTLWSRNALIFASTPISGGDSVHKNAHPDIVTTNTDTASVAHDIQLALTTQEAAVAINAGWPNLAPQMSRVEYAAQCQARMGRVPAFNCTAAYARVIPITGLQNNRCDNPNQLGSGRCVAGSRIGQLSTGNPDVTTVFICRKYSAVADPTFHDIAVIQHNRESGDTCWFQTPVGDDRDGRAAPSPMENSAAANQYWLEPADVAPIDCQKCHDADPFIWTPYLGQVLGQNPDGWNPWGPYDSNTFDIFDGRPQPRIFEPAGNSCVACHRIGERTVNDSNGAVDLVHRSIANPADPFDRDGNAWMPLSGAPNAAHIAQLERCGANPNLAECNTSLPSFAACTGTIRVDRSYSGPERGTVAQPFRTVGAAYDYACTGATLRIKAGSYPERPNMSKNVTLISEGGTTTIGP